SERLRRVRTLRYGSSYLTGWKSREPRRRDLFPERNGKDGTGNSEAVRYTDRNPDGPYRGTGGMAESHRVAGNLQEKNLQRNLIKYRKRKRLREIIPTAVSF